jgi:hypothetical protein
MAGDHSPTIWTGFAVGISAALAAVGCGGGKTSPDGGPGACSASFSVKKVAFY